MTGHDATSEATELPIDHAAPGIDDICAEHAALASEIGRLHTVAEAIATKPLSVLRPELEAVERLVNGRLVPHLRSEHERRALLAFHDHRHCPQTAEEAEIGRLAEQLGCLWPIAPGREGDADALKALRAVLFDLHTVARLQLGEGCC